MFCLKSYILNWLLRAFFIVSVKNITQGDEFSFMRRRLPLFFILCVGFVLGLSWALGEYFDRGGRLNLSILEPYYRSWLKKKGVHRAGLYIELEKTGHRQWVVGAENLVFNAGRVKDVRLYLGFDNGQVKLKRIHLDQVDLDLQQLVQGPATQNALLPVVLGLLMDTPGSIDHVRLYAGSDSSGSGWKKHLGIWDIANQGAGAATSDHEGSSGSVAFGSRDLGPVFLWPMDIKWDQGVVTFWPAIRPHGVNPEKTLSQNVPLEYTQNQVMPKKGPLPTAIKTLPSARSPSKNPTSTASKGVNLMAEKRPQDPGFNGMTKKKPSLAGSFGPFMTLHIKGHDSGARLTGSFQPMVWRHNPYGLSGMVLSGLVDARWSMKNKALDDAFYTIKINQSGSADLVEPGGVPMRKAGAKLAVLPRGKIPEKDFMQDSRCVIKNLVLDIQGEKDQKLSVNYLLLIDSARLAGAVHATKTTSGYQWSLAAKMTAGAISLVKMPILWPKISPDAPERDWILANFHGGSLTSARIDLKGALDPKGIEKFHCATVNGHLRIANMGLSFVPNMSRIQSMYMDSTFSKKGFHITVHKGRFEHHDVKGGVSIALDTQPVLLKFDTHLSGPAEYLLPVLLSFASSNSGAKGLDLSHVTGVDQTQVRGRIPLISNLSQADIDITMHSKIPSAGFVFSIGPRPLQVHKTAITIDYEKNKASINAMGLVNMVKTKWSWRNNVLHFSCQPDATQLESVLLFPIHPYMNGTATIQGTYDNRVCHVDLDLKHAQCSVPVIAWQKSLGAPLNLVLVKTDKKTQITAKGLGVSGSVTANHEPKATANVAGKIHMDKIFGRYMFTAEKKVSCFTDLVDGAQHSGRHQLFFRIPKMILSGLGKKESTSEKKNRKPIPENRGVQIDLDLACDQVDMDGIQMGHARVKLSGQAITFWPEDKDFLGNYTWNQGSFYSEHTAKNVKRPKKGFVMIGWDSVGKKSTKIDADVVDLGSVCNGLGLTQRIKGGDLHLEATQEASGYKGDVVIKNIKTKINALGKLLSIISPTMFTEMFSSGTTFKQLTMGFQYQSGKLEIINGIGKGLNLGLFLKGFVDIDSKNCHLQGVAVPSYLVNTFFSNIPIVGWILGGSKGLISSEFTVTGPVSNPKFKVIPFSLLKLGFLKNLSFFKESNRKNQQKGKKRPANGPGVVKNP
jgi:hypothetical protein